MYVCVFSAGIASLAPLPALRGAFLLARHPVAVVVLAVGLFAAGLTMSVASYWLIRRHGQSAKIVGVLPGR
jgi:hypothetical protein